VATVAGDRAGSDLDAADLTAGLTPALTPPGDGSVADVAAASALRAALHVQQPSGIDALPGPLLLLVEGDRLVYSGQLVGALGRVLADGLDRPLTAIVHDDDESAVRRLLATAASNPDVDDRPKPAGPVVVRIVDDGGVQRHIEFVATRERASGTTSFLLHGWDVSAYVRRESALKNMALHDPLTDLANRLLFAERVTGELRRRRRSHRQVAVLYADLDGFKEVNDTWGHRAGDLLLVSLAARLRDGLRPDDTLARLGGDEFGVCCPDLDSSDDALVVAHRVVEAATAPLSLGGATIRVSISVGVAMAVDDDLADGGQRLMARADLAMYAAKQAGRTRVALAPLPAD
jgi:diguanylate cyclase (GGDEF)-like protein